MQFLRILPCCAVLSLFAQAPAWDAKPVADWSEQDAKQILEASPWSKMVVPGIAPRPTEAERREGGNMGQPRGVGYDGIDDRIFHREVLGNPFGGPGIAPPPQPVFHLLVRWESALPVRAAEFKIHESGPPTLSDDGYTIAVYGVPGTYFKGDPRSLGEPLKGMAALRREGKKDVRPSLAEVFQLEHGAAVVYTFPLSAELGPRDATVEFSALIGRLQVSQTFVLGQMKFQGKLEL